MKVCRVRAALRLVPIIYVLLSSNCATGVGVALVTLLLLFITFESNEKGNGAPYSPHVLSPVLEKPPLEV